MNTNKQGENLGCFGIIIALLALAIWFFCSFNFRYSEGYCGDLAYRYFFHDLDQLIQCDSDKDGFISRSEVHAARAEWALRNGLTVDYNYVYKNGWRLDPKEAAKIAGLMK